jgi:hypothetical protein
MQIVRLAPWPIRLTMRLLLARAWHDPQSPIDGGITSMFLVHCLATCVVDREIWS